MQRPAERAGALARAGFTLVEVLVAMIIAGLLTGVIFQLMQGQASFVGIQSARQEVQQNARGTLEIISSELRAVPPGAITVAEVSRIEYRLPRVWGITCSAMPGGSGAVWVLIPEGTFPLDFPASPSSASDWGVAVPPVTGDGVWRWMTIASAASGTPSCDPSVPTASLDNYEAVQLGYNGLGNPRPIGSKVFIWQYVVYETGTGAGSSRVWVKRNNGSSAPQVMAGPLASTGGLVFDYWKGDARVSPPGSSSTGHPCLTAIQTTVTMESTRGTAELPQRLQDSARVSLRNAIGGPTC